MLVCRDLARELECDEGEAAFEEKVRKVAQKQKEPADRVRAAGSND